MGLPIPRHWINLHNAPNETNIHRKAVMFHSILVFAGLKFSHGPAANWTIKAKAIFWFRMNCETISRRIF